MVDRRRMFYVESPTIEIKNMVIQINGDTATVEFDQYYRSARYSDWGPKIMKIKATTAGEKIIYEDLKASYPLT
jgi:hypothetical protein